ncbi:MAG: hypothetical protein WA215_06000 [Candidatus Cybelea sp.]
MPGTPGNIAQDYSDLAGHVGDVIADTSIPKTPAQLTQLGNASNALLNYSNQLADAGAWAALNAAQSDFDQIKAATSTANAAAAALKTQASKLNSILTIVGDALTLGAKIVSGDLPGALNAASTLATDATSA